MFLSRVRDLAGLSAVRLTVGLLAVFILLSAVAWGGTYWLVQREITRLTDARLIATATAVQRAYDQDLDLPPPGFGQTITVTPAGAGPGPSGNRPEGIHDIDGRGPDQRVLLRGLSDGARLRVSENVARQDELLETLRGVVQVALIGVVAAGLLAGSWFAWRAQTRLRLIGQGLTQVARGHLGTRIALPGRPDDLSRLADRINETTARLEQSMAQLRVQSSSIAHDLRTPLARLRAGLEQGLLDLTEHGRAVQADDLGAALEQIDRIIATFNALLRLSRLESGAGRDGFAPLDLGDIAADLAETFAPVVEDAGQRWIVEVTDAEQIQGDRDLLVQLAANLIQNALRHGAEGQQITLAVQGTQMSITDEGPGIPPEERTQVLQPLYQREAARQGEGVGLGLSLVAAISDLHDGRLTLSDGPGGRGLRVAVEFPKLTDL